MSLNRAVSFLKDVIARKSVTLLFQSSTRTHSPCLLACFLLLFSSPETSFPSADTQLVSVVTARSTVMVSPKVDGPSSLASISWTCSPTSNPTPKLKVGFFASHTPSVFLSLPLPHLLVHDLNVFFLVYEATISIFIHSLFVPSFVIPFVSAILLSSFTNVTVIARLRGTQLACA
jgi:hypothetical protein